MKKLIYINIVLLLTSCYKDHDLVKNPKEPSHEEEVISTVLLTLNHDQTKVFKWEDLDGPGGDEPIIDTIRIEKDSIYHVEVLLINNIESEADTISIEILNEESEEHQVFFVNENISMDISYLDFDTGTPPKPLGMKVSLSTAQSGTGSLTIILKHQPDGKTGDINTGSTDLEVTFPFASK